VPGAGTQHARGSRASDSRSGKRSGSRGDSGGATPRALVFAVSFVALLAVLAIRNASLFSDRYYEAGDQAANSILIEQARHLRLLVGNYSRLGFNHPGPAYLYVQAGGEEVLYDLLHATPTPWNAQLLAVYALNSAFVGLAVAVVYGWTRSVAAAAACLAAFAVFAALHPMILSSDWMPYLYVPTYAVFVLAAASVAAGAGRDVWIFALCGWFLIHGHAAYLFFVPALALVVLAALCWPRRRRMLAALRASPATSLRALLRRHRRAWIPATAISAVFALPIVIDLALHWPGSFGRYLSYSSSSASGGHSTDAVISYVLWFWWPGSAAPANRLMGFIPLLAAVTATELTWWCARGQVRRFLLTLLGVNVVSTVAFIGYAAAGIDNLTRNGHYIGYFYWTAPLLTLVTASVALAEALSRTRPKTTPRALPQTLSRTRPNTTPRVLPRTFPAALPATIAAIAAVAAIAVFAATPQARTSASYSDPAAPWISPPDTDAAIPGAVATLAARSPGTTLVLNLDHDAWVDLTGFLMQASRTGVRACVDDPAWAYMITSQFICTPQEAAAGAHYYLHFTGVPARGTVLTRMQSAWVTAAAP
jgi:hypothetical protein